MISHDKTGGRTIHLFIPFEYNGKQVTSITLAPLRLGHVIRWNEGVWRSMIDLLVDLAGVDKAVIHELRYPDADRVLDNFMQMLTPEIRDDIANSRIPLPTEEPTPRATNGSGEPMDDTPRTMMAPPGVPLPEAGFDLGEEP